jgi:hypothetical protein
MASSTPSHPAEEADFVVVEAARSQGGSVVWAVYPVAGGIEAC